jgi:ATP-dependent helicase/nuclease subunit A
MNFTTDQLEAVDASRSHLDACVTAGPGSGKTTVLVEYFRRLVESGVNPQQILAITFTEKAAANMRKKLAEAFRADALAALRADLERGWVSTVHGFCARLLKENAVFAGVDPDFYVADERESWRLEQESISEAVSNMFREHPAAVRALIRGLASHEFETLVISAYDAIRGAGMTIEEMAAMPAPPDNAQAELEETLRALENDPLSGCTPAQRHHTRTICVELERIVHADGPLEALYAIEGYSGNLNKLRSGTTARQLAKDVKKSLNRFQYSLITKLYWREREALLEILRCFDRFYRQRKRSLGALDFADLEEYAVRLVEENPEIRCSVQRQFEHVLMDEFQDTNGQQAKLLDLVRRTDRFYAVGDINQSIYGFRHAEPEVFRDYRRDVERRGHRLVDLKENFRSRSDILRAVETMVHLAEGLEPRPLVAAQVFENPRPVAVELIGVIDEETDEALEKEARWVAHRILELIVEDPPFRFQDIAVLVRNTEVIPQFTDAFEQAGIPHVVNRGRGFFEAREVKDLYHLLRVIVNPRDEISLAAVLRSPLVQVSDEALLALRGAARGLSDSLIDVEQVSDVPADDLEKLIHFRDGLHDWRLRREAVSFDRLLLDAIDDCGYCSDSWTNIEKFLAQARDAAARMPLDDFVDLVARLRDDNIREPEAPPEDSSDAVSIMTVHSAKGLEFPVVFVAAMHKGTRNDVSMLAFSRNYGLGARWRNPATGEDKSDLFLHAINEERKRRENEEGHRLLYVAMTRAEQHLVLSFSGKGKKLDQWAKVVVDRVPGLASDLTAPRDEVLTLHSPAGEPWKLRLLVTAEAPGPLLRPAIPEGARSVEWLAPAARTGQQDTNATVTELAAFARCPRQYYLGDYLGFASRPAAGSPTPTQAAATQAASASEFGSLVHALLSGEPIADPDPRAAAMAETFRQSALGRRAARAARVEREYDFVMAVEGLVLRGQIDLWFEEGGELVIVDYKTDAVNAAEAHQRAGGYSIQLRLYALAVERITGRTPGRAWLHFLRPNTLIEVDLTPSLLDSPEQLVREFQEAQARLAFPLREGEHCTRCAFFGDLCPSAYTPNRSKAR